MTKLYSGLSSFLVIIMLAIGIPLPTQTGIAATPPLPNCRFGITVPKNMTGIDISPVRIGAMLNWGIVGSLPSFTGVEFINVLRVGDRCFDNQGHQTTCSLPDNPSPYQETLATYQALVTAHPGMAWSIGNEPDTARSIQDDVTAEVYATRYFTIATGIRAIDPTARLGFGAVVGMTPIRMRYLDRAWNQLVTLAGSPSAASALIDFWGPHNFLLNETPGGWGSDVPPGFGNDHADAVKITNFGDTYNISKFSARVKNFRAWMVGKGEQNKPLWITDMVVFSLPLTDQEDQKRSTSLTPRHQLSC